MMRKIAVIGAGSWGTALAIHLARQPCVQRAALHRGQPVQLAPEEGIGQNLEMLQAAQQRNGSMLCVGLDPEPTRFPLGMTSNTARNWSSGTLTITSRHIDTYV